MSRNRDVGDQVLELLRAAPSCIPTIAKALNMDASTIQYAVKRLQADGRIAWHGTVKLGRSTRWSIIWKVSAPEGSHAMTPPSYLHQLMREQLGRLQSPMQSSMAST